LLKDTKHPRYGGPEIKERHIDRAVPKELIAFYPRVEHSFLNKAIKAERYCPDNRISRTVSNPEGEHDEGRAEKKVRALYPPCGRHPPIIYQLLYIHCGFRIPGYRIGDYFAAT
jgi:hypothetical protein